MNPILVKLTAALNLIGNLAGNAAIIALVPDPYKFWVLVVGNAAHVLISYLANPTGTALGAFLKKSA